jgi:hypothetical protein
VILSQRIVLRKRRTAMVLRRIVIRKRRSAVGVIERANWGERRAGDGAKRNLRGTIWSAPAEQRGDGAFEFVIWKFAISRARYSKRCRATLATALHISCHPHYIFPVSTVRLDIQ